MLDRYDRTAFDPPAGRSRVRLTVTGRGSDEHWDVLIASERDRVRLRRADPRRRSDAALVADRDTWAEMARDVRAGLEAYRSGRLHVRHNLHLAIGLLAATAARQPGRLEVRLAGPRGGRLSSLQAGRGEPVLMLHGLGATKASFLPTINALAASHRAIALDLPGFGDAEKPFGAAYDAAFFARFVAQAFDALDLKRAHVIGHSMGGRVALELGLQHPERVQSLTLLTPSLAWRRPRPWAPYLRWVRPELGVLQPAPRAIVDPLVRRLVPGADSGWSAVGVDEFLRGFLHPRGRAAFYAAARSIYLEEPSGPNGLWERIEGITTPSLFVWGARDQLVPAAFARHVERAVPHADHIALDCAHVPQFERPRELHAQVLRFLSSHPMTAGGDALVARRR